MNDAFVGASRLGSASTEFNQIEFIVRQIMNRKATTTLVTVVKSENDGDVSPVGFVSVSPMIHQIDGEGNATPHGVIHNIPYFRVQGGENAVIIDPAVGDIGIAVFAREDISSVKNNKAPSNPGSRRKYDMADGLYIGGVLNGTPTQFIRFSPDGIELSAAKVKISCDVEIVGGLTVTEDAVASGISLTTHTHSGVTAGSGNTGGPNA